DDEREEEQGDVIVAQALPDAAPIAADALLRRRVDGGARVERGVGHVFTLHSRGAQPRLMRGSMTVCRRSTTRLIPTKARARTRIVPWRSGMSRVRIALLRRKPVPGQVKTVSIRIEPPIR